MKRKDELMLQKVGDQALLIPLGAKVLDMNGMVVRNTTGSFIWELLAEERSFEELVSAVVERFAVEADRAGTDVRTFLDDFIRQGWIAL